MTKVEEQVLELTKCAVNEDYDGSKNLSNLTEAQAEDIINEAKAQAVASLVLPKILEYNPDFRKKYENLMLSIVSRNIQVIDEHARIGYAFEKANIEYVIIKGFASAEYYIDTNYRQMGDIDVLVRPSDFETASKILVSLGYSDRGRTYEHHNTFSNNGKICELHHIIGYITEDGNDLSKLTEDIITTRRKAKTPSGEIYVPSAYYHGLIMLLHIYKHMFFGVGLRHICDWAVFIKSAEAKKIYADLYNAAKNYSLSGLLKTLTDVSSLYINTTKIKYFGSEDTKLSKEFIEIVMSGGNFGEKYENKVWTMFVNHSYKNQSLIKRMYTAVKGNVHARMPKTKKNKFLFVLGFISTPFYYAFMYLTGKKVPMLKQNKMLAQGKNDLFSKLSDKK